MINIWELNAVISDCKKNFDLFQADIAELGSVLETPAEYSLINKGFEQAFARRAVPTVSLAAHRTNHPARGQHLLGVVDGTLTSVVRNVHLTLRRAATEPHPDQ